MLTSTRAVPTVRGFEPNDAMLIVNRDGVQVPVATIVDQAERGPAWTAVVDGKPLACGGIVLLWPGVGSAWMVFGSEMSAYRMWFTRTVRAFLHATMHTCALNRVECVALVESELNQLWLQSMGFTQEQNGVARAFLETGQDVRRFELMKERD